MIGQLSRRACAWAFAAAVIGATTGLAGAQAQSNYPNKPVRIVVPYAPGGATDVYARLVAKSLADQLAIPVLVVGLGLAAVPADLVGVELHRGAVLGCPGQQAERHVRGLW